MFYLSQIHTDYQSIGNPIADFLILVGMVWFL
jgi:hypothetical protein